MKLLTAVLAVLLLAGHSVAQAQAGTCEVVRNGDKFSIEAERVPIGDLLTKLFAHVEDGWSMDPDVAGNVTVSLRNVAFETILQGSLRQVDAVYSIEDSQYRIQLRVSCPPEFILLLIGTPHMVAEVNVEEEDAVVLIRALEEQCGLRVNVPQGFRRTVTLTAKNITPQAFLKLLGVRLDGRFVKVTDREYTFVPGIRSSETRVVISRGRIHLLASF